MAILLVTYLSSDTYHPYYSGRRPHYDSYGGGTSAQGYAAQSDYKEHLLSHSDVHYGENTTVCSGCEEEFPGKDEGFERGEDKDGNEIYRYEGCAVRYDGYVSQFEPSSSLESSQNLP